MLLTRSPLIQPNKSQVFSVRLACVKHAASVRPEPGSNSPNKNKNVKAQKNQPNKTVQPAIPTKNTQKQKTGIKQKQTNTLSSSQTTPTHSKAHRRTCITFERCFAPSSHDQASHFVRCRSAQQEELYALARRSSNRGFAPPSTRTSAGFRGFRQDSAPYQAIFPRFSCARTQNVTQSVCHDALQTARRTPLTWRYSRTITFFAQNFTAR